MPALLIESQRVAHTVAHGTHGRRRAGPGETFWQFRHFDQNDARQLVTTATARHLGMLAFWEVTRDRNACTGALYQCTNITQQPYEFSRIFAGFRG